MPRLIARWITAVVAVVVSALALSYCYRLYFNYVRGYEPPREQYPVRGIDISAHNGHVDFDRVTAEGYSFVIAKATEGTDFADRAFADNLRRASDAGMAVGAYHFFRFDTDGAMQATNFINAIRGRRLDFPAIIDVEESGNPAEIPVAEVVERLRRMIARMEHFGYRVMIYTSPEGYNRYIRSDFGDYPVWLCSLTDLDKGIPWEVWQYSHTGHVDGINGYVDLNTIKEAPAR